MITKTLQNDSGSTDHQSDLRATSHEKALFKAYGPLIHGKDLIQVAGFATSEAFRLAVRRNKVGFQVFLIPGRRGRFARVSDVAFWLAELDARISSAAVGSTTGGDS